MKLCHIFSSAATKWTKYSHLLPLCNNYSTWAFIRINEVEKIYFIYLLYKHIYRVKQTIVSHLGIPIPFTKVTWNRNGHLDNLVLMSSDKWRLHCISFNFTILLAISLSEVTSSHKGLRLSELLLPDHRASITDFASTQESPGHGDKHFISISTSISVLC